MAFSFVSGLVVVIAVFPHGLDPLNGLSDLHKWEIWRPQNIKIGVIIVTLSLYILPSVLLHLPELDLCLILRRGRRGQPASVSLVLINRREMLVIISMFNSIRLGLCRVVDWHDCSLFADRRD